MCSTMCVPLKQCFAIVFKESQTGSSLTTSLAYVWSGNVEVKGFKAVLSYAVTHKSFFIFYWPWKLKPLALEMRKWPMWIRANNRGQVLVGGEPLLNFTYAVSSTKRGKILLFCSILYFLPLKPMGKGMGLLQLSVSLHLFRAEWLG